MKICLNIREKILNTYKYYILAFFIITTLSYAYFFQWANSNTYLLIAVIFAIYMAINLWANDVANNMGPAVGSKAVTLGWAIILAMIFEAAWALIAGWDVVNTIKWWIINWELINKNSIEFIAIMLSTLLWAAIWVNIATFLKAPVSITHAIFWWLIWAWITYWFSNNIANYGLDIVNWWEVWQIAWAWVIAILMWWFIAMFLYISIRKTILKRDHKWEAAKDWVPIYVALMAWIFSLYLILKWFKHKLAPVKDFFEFHSFNFNAVAIFTSVIIGIIIYTYLVIKFKNKKKSFFEDSKDFVNELFNIPLVFAVALLSFAHWANDVANAIWPLAAINEAVNHHWIINKAVWVPFWIMFLWALFLSLWLAIFWAKLIKTVWNKITKLDQTRAYSIALSAAITVIIASALWIPVSTTQIALGWVFWIWLYRQHLKRKKWKTKTVIKISKLKWIILSWVVTLPFAWIIASITYLTIIWLSK